MGLIRGCRPAWPSRKSNSSPHLSGRRLQGYSPKIRKQASGLESVVVVFVALNGCGSLIKARETYENCTQCVLPNLTSIHNKLRKNQRESAFSLLSPMSLALVPLKGQCLSRTVHRRFCSWASHFKIKKSSCVGSSQTNQYSCTHGRGPPASLQQTG